MVTYIKIKNSQCHRANVSRRMRGLDAGCFRESGNNNGKGGCAAHRCHNVINSFYTGARKSADYRANMKVSSSLRVLTSKLSHGQGVRGV